MKIAVGTNSIFEGEEDKLVERLGRYEILDEIGQGGFAVVYRAHDTQLDRLVALKELRPMLLNDPDLEKDFRQEARNIARLDHPNVVTIYDVYGAQQRLFIVMQLVDGSSLKEQLDIRGRLSWSETVETITTVAEGLDYAHTRGILHRDLKPANILLDSKHGPMLSDFGLAKLIGEAGASVSGDGGVVGTPHYIAPEVWGGQSTTRQSDIYALGCILYEMLIGEKLFSGETPPTVMMAHLRGLLTLPHTWPEGVPSDVAGVLGTALAQKPADRYATAREMAKALTTLVKSELVTSLPGPTKPETGPVSSPILTTKLYIPPTRPELVSRSRLIEWLNEGLHRKLTLASAPAGFGKTTLVSDWLSHFRFTIADFGLDPPSNKLTQNSQSKLQNRVAWLSLDEGDNDPVRFLTYFVAALGTIEANIGRGVLSTLQSPQPPPTEAVLTSLLNEIATIPNRIILVLDDYHLIEAQSVHDALTFLLEHLSPQMHLVIATREDPPLPLARLRARDQLTELRAMDLRFTASEAAEFLNQVMGLELSSEDIATLETRTEGWITGLQLAAISMQGREDVTSFIKSFTGSHHYILDYLIEEVLERQSESVQTFLLETSILNRLTGSLCDALTDQDNGQATLEMLEHANLFIVPLDEERRWYRYHHLFADLLRLQLGRKQPDWTPILHIRASEWYQDYGFVDQAITHALRGEDFERAAYLLEEYADALVQRGEHTIVSDWINALPDRLAREHPYLCVHHAWALQLMGQFDAAEARLADAEEALANLSQENDADAETIRGHIHSHRAYLTFIRGEHAQTINYARQALEQLPPKATEIRNQTALYLGVAYRFQGEFQAALDIFTEAVTLSQKMGGSVTAVLSFLNLAELYTEQAHLHQAMDIYEQALQFTKRHAGRPDIPFTGYVYVGIGRILRQWNELDDAYRHTTKGIALCRDRNAAELLALSCIELAHIHQALDNDGQAGKALQEAKQIFAGFSPWGSDRVAAYQAQFDLTRGEVKSAERWAQAGNLTIEGELELHRELEYLILARVFVAQNRFDQALSLLERLNQTTQAIGKMQSVLETLMLQAMALFAQGQTGQALIKLEQALAIGEPENYVRIFVDEGPPMARLLYEALSHGIASDYVSRLLAAFPTADSEQVAPPQTQALASDLIEPLSERELEVLQLIADGLTNPEIGSRLYVTLNTVKVHTRNIYGKLDAHNRTQAVAKARALGVLPPI